MQKNQVISFVIILGSLVILALIFSAAFGDYDKNKIIATSPFWGLIGTWICQLIGLATLVLGVIELTKADLAKLDPVNLSKTITVVLLGLLILHTSWYMVLSLVILLAVLIIIDHLNKRNTNNEISAKQDAIDV